MVSHTLTAQIVLDKNSFAVYSAGPPATGDFTLVNTEYIIDDCIDFINGQVEVDVIPSLSGTAGSKTVTITGSKENSAFNFGITILLREAKKTSLSNSSSTSGSSSTNKNYQFGPVGYSQGSSVGTAMSAAAAINNEQNSPEARFFWEAIAALKKEYAGEIEADLA